MGIAREQMVSASPKRGAGGVLARSLTITEYLHRPCLPAPVQVALAATILRRGGESTGFHILAHLKPTKAFKEGRQSRTFVGHSALLLALPIVPARAENRPLGGPPPDGTYGARHLKFSSFFMKGSTDD